MNKIISDSDEWPEEKRNDKGTERIGKGSGGGADAGRVVTRGCT